MVKEQTEAERQLHKQLVEIAEKQSYILLPRSYYEKLFNGFDKMKRDIIRAREARDKYKEELRTLKTNKTHSGGKE